MDLLKYLEPMKNLPEQFSNLAFWRGVRLLMRLNILTVGVSISKLPLITCQLCHHLVTTIFGN